MILMIGPFFRLLIPRVAVKYSRGSCERQIVYSVFLVFFYDKAYNMYRMYIDNLICICIAVRSVSGSEKDGFPGICLFFMKKMLFFI